MERHRLESDRVRVQVLALGAALHRVEVGDAAGRWTDVHLFHDRLDHYRDRRATPFLGASVGRYANRIDGARFTLDGREITLDANDGGAHLHGGHDGFDRREWSVVGSTRSRRGGSLALSLRSPDGDQGYPGTLVATSEYRLDGDQLTVTYRARTDAPTVVNLTNHAYWNLAGVGPSRAQPLVDHELTVAADRYLPVDDGGIPVGGLVDVEATPFDLREPRLVSEVTAAIGGGGLDHCFALRPTGGAVRPAAQLRHLPSGRTLTVATDQVGLQVYGGGQLGPPFAPGRALCLEAQCHPDTPNRPLLGSARLDPGDTYTNTTQLTFTAQRAGP